MHRLTEFGIESPRKISQREYAPPDYSLGSVELVGQGVYSALMVDELLSIGVPVSSYVVKDLPRETKIEFFPHRTDFSRFSTPRGLARVIGNAQHIVLFNLGMQVPDSVLERLGEDIWNIHPSKLPEYAGASDPVKDMVYTLGTYGHITIHQVTSDIDAGPIIAHKSFPFKPTPRGKKFDERLISEIYRDSVIPAGARLLKHVLEERKRRLTVPVRRSRAFKDLALMSNQGRTNPFLPDSTLNPLETLYGE